MKSALVFLVGVLCALGIAAQDSVRYSVKRTVPLILEDWRTRPFDLRNPTNVITDVQYNAQGNYYMIRTTAGGKEVGTPLMLSPLEYAKWSLEQSNAAYYRTRNRELMSKDGDEFDFTNLQFDLGPAERIFGKGGVRITTRGSAELKFGITTQNLENPSLSERMKKTLAFDFDEKINLTVNGKVGDKMNMDFNYNTDATFDFDAQKIKLRYEGKEDEIIKLLEAGNVSMPSSNSLIRGASTLFGIRTDLQFGKLKLQTVISQQESESKTVRSQGGVQSTPFELSAVDYDENRHFFIADFFRHHYDRNMASLPNIMSGITITRMEVWITNKSGNYDTPRNIIAFTQLGEGNTPTLPPANANNGFYSDINTNYSAARDITQVSSTLNALDAGHDYEKIESARLLRSNEYTLNTSLGYISLRTALRADEVLAVAFSYTYMGQTYQVGELAADIPDNSKALFTKLLKSTTNSPAFPAWKLMMKNIYSLRAQQIQKDNFTLNISYQNDSAGTALNYISEGAINRKLLVRVMNLDRLDNMGKNNPDGVFDFVQPYTIRPNEGLLIFPVVEPFGAHLRAQIGSDLIADKYVYQEIYDSTKTYAKQLTEKNKFTISGTYKANNSSEISLGAIGVPRGSVVVKAGGQILTENTDYTVDYTQGVVRILNQNIIDAGTPVSVSLESNSNFSMQRRTMMGLNAQYDFSKDLTIGGTIMKMSERPLRSKVSMGSEPINNLIWGGQFAWKKESQWLTNVIDKLPFLNATAPSMFNITAEVAQLIPGTTSDLQDDASYIDDFESAEMPLDLRSPASWMMASTPSRFPESTLNNDVRYGYNRALLAWYYIDPLFTNRNSSLTPGHIKGDLNQLSNHYIREVYQTEVFPHKETAFNESATLSILNMAYYPSERGAYNLDPQLNADGSLPNPRQRWGAMMRKIDNPDFETSNVGYVEFWLLDPFIYNPTSQGGDFYLNLGEVSEDVLKDGRKSFENGLPTSAESAGTEQTAWGKVPLSRSLVYAFDTNSGSRRTQDVGLDGLSSAEEQSFPSYSNYLAAASNLTEAMQKDPAGDDYHYYRGSDYDAAKMPVLARYKRYNMPEGNSVASEDSPESYDISAKNNPDAEDINQDFTLSENEKYYEYRIHLTPNMKAGDGYITSVRTTNVKLRNGQMAEGVKWYQFKVPIREYTNKVGNIQDFSSIRFMRMYLTDFADSVVLRFAKLALIRADWRTYDKPLRRRDGGVTSTNGTLELYSVGIEENSDKQPVNYVMPPGISRVIDPGQPQLRQENEQALSLKVSNIKTGDAKAVYKQTTLDLRRYNRLQLFAHAEALSNDNINHTALEDKDIAMFVRLGNDFNNNYYEYEIPLNVTPEGNYDGASLAGCQTVWPQANMLDINPSILTALKKQRNSAGVAYTTPFATVDAGNPNNTLTIVGNPSLTNVSTIMIGVRNLSSQTRSAEVWINELRVKDFDESGGWAAQGDLTLKLSDVGSVVASGHYETDGFGGLEESVSQRRKDSFYQYSISTQVDAGRFLPSWLKLQAPIYYSYQRETISPKYDPVNEDLLLEDVLETYHTQSQKDSVLNVAQTLTTFRNFSLSNMRFNVASKKPMPYDPANLAISYSWSKREASKITTAFDNTTNWKLGLAYTYSPVYKPFAPFSESKGTGGASKFLQALSLNYLPQNIGFTSDLSRYYQETQLRDIENSDADLPLTVSKTFLWNRKTTLRWDILKSLQLNFNSATQAEIEEPIGPVNSSLYPDAYSAWKDSITRSLLSLGTPLDYNQTFSASYKPPFSLIPILDWIKGDASYNSNYSWQRGIASALGIDMGNTIANQGTFNMNGGLEFDKLYNKSPFLAAANKRFSGTPARPMTSAERRAAAEKANAKFEQEITLSMDSTIVVKHGQDSKNPRVSAITADGKRKPIQYKVKDRNTITITTLDSVPVKLTVQAGKRAAEQSWYKPMQVVARAAMMVRNISFTYRNTRSMTLPGFMPEVGDFYGQRSGTGGMSPGLDFAFGLTDENYIGKARDKGWLLNNDSVSSYAQTSNVEELQLKATVEPFAAFKIDLTASHMTTASKTVQYMFTGMPTTRTGNFNMSIITIGTAFESSKQSNGYRSATFEKFLDNIAIIQQRVQSQYTNSTYPAGWGNGMAGQAYDPANGEVSPYSADVLLPAFLASYSGNDASSASLKILPSMLSMLPNWNITYSGMARLPLIKKFFRSFDITHGYKSVYSIGSYNSFSSFMSYMGDAGFVQNVSTGMPTPSGPLDINTVSINEAFSPLLGANATLLNGVTTKLEYRRTRVITLSVSALQVVESMSGDWVIGAGYKIIDFQPWAPKMKGRNANANNNAASTAPTGNNPASSVSHDLNLRFDVSFRSQSALSRNIMDGTTLPTSGNRAVKFSLSADYTLSRQLTLRMYYDYQRNEPLISSSSFPVTNTDFGATLRFNLTR